MIYFVCYNFFSLNEFIEGEEQGALKTIAESTLIRLDTRMLIKIEFVAASILDPGQVHSSIIGKYLQDQTPLELLKSLWEKYNLNDQQASYESPLSPVQATSSSETLINEVTIQIMQKILD